MNDSKHLDDLLARFGRKPKESFAVLRPQAELIKGLRQRGASFETIRQVLQRKGNRDVSDQHPPLLPKGSGRIHQPIVSKAKVRQEIEGDLGGW